MEGQIKMLEKSCEGVKPYILKVATYNILADCYTKGSSLKNYPGKDLAVLQDFNFRSKRVIREFT